LSTPLPPTRESIAGLVLAGGRATRWGGQDKGLLPFRGRPLIEWAIEALTPQVGTVLINANRNLDAYAALGHPVIPDTVAGFQGPLAGLAAAMAVCPAPWIATVPCDGPFLAPDLVGRLISALVREGAEIAVASDGRRIQPVHALVPIALAPSLNAYLAGGERKAELWLARHRLAVADLGDRPLCFANLNRPEDAEPLEGPAARSPGP
jgi:molybdopterin-guanine dinucleotide biosynthesis protein A